MWKFKPLVLSAGIKNGTAVVENSWQFFKELNVNTHVSPTIHSRYIIEE